MADLVELEFGVGVRKYCPLRAVFFTFLCMFVKRSLCVAAMETTITDEMFSSIAGSLSVHETA